MIYSRSTRILRGGAATLAVAFAMSGTAGVNAQHAAASKPAKAPPGGPGGPGILGTLKSASANTLKITTLPAHGTATVRLSPKTIFRVNGRSTKTHPTWKRGEQVQVTGSKSKTGVYLATTVSVGTLPAFGPPPGGSGAPGGPGAPGGAPPTSGKVVAATSTQTHAQDFTGHEDLHPQSQHTVPRERQGEQQTPVAVSREAGSCGGEGLNRPYSSLSAPCRPRHPAVRRPAGNIPLAGSPPCEPATG